MFGHNCRFTACASTPPHGSPKTSAFCCELNGQSSAFSRQTKEHRPGHGSCKRNPKFLTRTCLGNCSKPDMWAKWRTLQNGGFPFGVFFNHPYFGGTPRTRQTHVGINRNRPSQQILRRGATNQPKGSLRFTGRTPNSAPPLYLEWRLKGKL